MSDSSVEIRPIVDLKGCQYFQIVQGRIWPGDLENLVPTHVLVTQVKNGGLLLGAYTSDGPPESGGMVGILLGWPGLALNRHGERMLKHCSHILGVLPAWQGQGIGRRMKLLQRQILLDQGIAWVTWTYDPLQRVNAYLNIHRLGATCMTYLCNVYGEMTDPLNAGLPTDRFQVDWHLDSPRVRHALSACRQDPAWNVDQMEVLSALLPAPESRLPIEANPVLDGRPLAVPLPDNVSALRHENPARLLAWRLFLRHAIEQAFAAGYVVVDCVALAGQGWHYILIPRTAGLSGSADWLATVPASG